MSSAANTGGINNAVALAPDQWRRDVQDFLNAMLIVRRIADMRFRSDLIAGDSVDWPFFNEPRVQTYTPSTDLTIDPTDSTSDKVLVDQSRAATFNVDPVELRQANFKGYPQKLARQAAHNIAQEMDQNVLNDGITNATTSSGTTTAPLTLNSGNIFEEFSDNMAALVEENAADGPMFAVIDPQRTAILSQSEVANGFNKADKALENGFVGPSSTGFKVFESNNLPAQVSLTVATNITATDTMTIRNITWTFVATGTATAAGEISLGASAAATQVNIVLAINGTGTAGASTYIDVSLDERRKLQNRQVSAGAFATNVSTITGFGKLRASQSFTDPTDGFSNEIIKLLFGRMGALAVAMQDEPQLEIRPEPKNFSENYLTRTLYGFKTFNRNAKRLLSMTIVA